jgi:hypothetical protein
MPVRVDTRCGVCRGTEFCNSSYSAILPDPPKTSPSGFLSRCSSPCHPQDYGFSFCAFAGSFAPEAGWISRGFGFVVSSREKCIEENGEEEGGHLPLELREF